MDLVDGHVHVLVVLVVVAGCDVLVFGEPKDVDKMFHNVPELLPVEASVLGVKRDDEVIRSVLACPGVLRLDGLDQPAGELDVGNRTRVGVRQGPGWRRTRPESSRTPSSLVLVASFAATSVVVQSVREAHARGTGPRAVRRLGRQGAY